MDAKTMGERAVSRLRTALTSNAALVLAVLTLTGCATRFTQRIQVNGGLGWDGLHYGEWARDFHGAVLKHGVDAYQLQRVVPSAVVHYTLRLLHVSRTPVHVIRAFAAVNVALLALTALAWCRVASRLGIGMRGRWLGAVCLFVNFACLKWLAYDPVLTDGYALALGTGMLACYLAGRTLALAALTAVGAFTWPTLIYQGLLLLAFRPNCSPEADRPADYRLNAALAAVAATAVYTFLIALVARGDHGYDSPFWAAHRQRLFPRALDAAAVAAAVCVAAYLLFGLSRLWDSRPLFRLADWRHSFCLTGVLTGAVIALGSRDLVRSLAAQPSWFTTRDVVLLFAWESVEKPALFLLSHIVFFGPVVLLALLRWGRVVRAVHTQGLGLTLCFTFNLLLALDAESRHLMHFLPLLVPFVILAVEDVARRPAFLAAFALLAVASSKVWLRLPALPEVDKHLEFPAQRLFMNLGPWMSGRTYYVQGAAVLLAGVALAVLLRTGAREGVGARTDRAEDAAQPQAGGEAGATRAA